MSLRQSKTWLDHRDKFAVAFLLLLSVWFSALRWDKMISLWGDSPRSLFEAYRVFSGDIPYRDVASVYPPLSMYLFTIFYKLFGQTFVASEILLDIMSVGVVISTFFLARQFLPWFSSVAIAVGLAFAGVTGGSAFALYSLDMYSPSALLASTGLNLLLLGLIAMLRGESIRSTSVWLASVGVSVAILSRSEFVIPVFACLGLVGLHLWSTRRQPGQAFVYPVKLLAGGLLMLLPAALAYVCLIRYSSVHSVVAGLLNYGSAKLACPYWPTGLGFLGFSAGLAEVALVYIFAVFLLSKVDRAQIFPYLGGALLAAFVVGAFLYAAWDDFPRYWALAGPRPHVGLRQGLTAIFALAHFLVPVMSAAVVLTCASIWRLLRALLKRRSQIDVTPETLVYIAGAALCIRSLFGSLWTEVPTITSSTYPILFVIAGILLRDAFRLPLHAQGIRFSIAKAIPSAIFLMYGIARFAMFLATGVHYYPVQTSAGRILLEDPVSVAVYNYVNTETGRDDLVADLGVDGGGVNFSARRRAPLFMTFFAFFTPAEEYLSRDADLIRTAKPAFVIGNTDDHLGTMYGGGTVTGCPFPALRWRSERITGDPARLLPIVPAVTENYTPVFRAGSIEVLKRNDLTGPSRDAIKGLPSAETISR